MNQTNVLWYLHACGMMVQLDIIHDVFCGCSMRLAAIDGFEFLQAHGVKYQIGGPSPFNLGKG